MRYFLFEGILKEGKQKFFSSVLTPETDRELTLEELKLTLKEYGAKLIKIEDEFEFDINNVDEKNEDNDGWLSCYEEVRRFKDPVLTPFQKFPE